MVTKAKSVETVAQNDAVEFDYESYAGDTVASSTIPYAQVQTPPNLDPSQIEKLGLPYGIFLIKAQADAVNFVPDSNWTETEISFGEGSTAETQQGYIAKKVRFCVVSSSSLEVEKGEYLDSQKIKIGKYKYVGQAYKGGIETAEGKLSREEKLYRNYLRLLVMFLDENNNPLHDSPFQIKWRGGFKGTMSVEMKEFYKAVGEAYYKGAASKGVKVNKDLSQEAKKFAVTSVEFGVHKSPGLAPFTSPVKVEIPTFDKIGQTWTIDRAWNGVGRIVEYVGIPLGKALLAKSSEAYKVISEAAEAYPEFHKPRYENAEEEPTIPVNKIQGSFDESTYQYNENAELSANFVTEDGTVYQTTLKGSQIELIDQSKFFVITGTATGNKLVIKEITIDVTKDTQSDIDYDDRPF